MKTFLLTIITIALMVAAVPTYAQKIEVKGGYNGHGYQPGYTLDLRTGWGRVNGPQGGFNFRPESGYTRQLPSAPNRPGQYPRTQPRINYNLGRPYIAPQGNFRPEPRGGWYNENWNKKGQNR